MYFVDLFVRVSNKAAIGMYEGLGYSVYRRILGYYCDPDEDAYGKEVYMRLVTDLSILDMRKALPRDVEKRSVVPLKHPVHWQDLKPW